MGNVYVYIYYIAPIPTEECSMVISNPKECKVDDIYNYI